MIFPKKRGSMTLSYQYFDDALLQKILKKHQQNLAYLEGQAASFGVNYVPLPLHNDITSEQAKIALIIAELEKRRSNNAATDSSKETTPEVYNTFNQSQLMHILHILHQEQKKGVKDLDLTELAPMVQLAETTLKPIIAYLNEKGWISFKKYLRGIEIISIINITDRGIDALTEFQDNWEN
jgi:DNA-binding MarR family transcriptional regulator